MADILNAFLITLTFHRNPFPEIVGRRRRQFVKPQILTKGGVANGGWI